MIMDAACSLGLLLSMFLLAGIYVARVVRLGPVEHARVTSEGKSALLPRGSMEMVYWAADPAVAGLARLGATPDAVTYASLVLGVAAGACFATGHFGLGAVVGTLGAACDALDGLLARHLGVASDAGELLDAAVDRYVDFALLAGLAFYFRFQTGPLLATLAALLATFMVSYSTAKADALGVTPPRGSMRRVERCVLILVAATVTPLLHEDLALVAAVAAIGVFGNASAVRRLASIRRSAPCRP
jgi:phosphatidylglycerophosphate synthase